MPAAVGRAGVALVALVALGVAPAAGARLSDDGVRDAAREVLADPSYEKTLPEQPKLRPREPGERRVRVRRNGGARTSPRAPSPGSTVSETILFVLLGVVGAAVLLWLAQEVARRRRGSKAREAKSATGAGGLDDEARRSALDEMPATLKNAHALADEGRYEDAIHLLLRGAIETVAKLARIAIQPAMTSREVLDDAELDAAAEGAFRDLVFSVEVSLFGGLPVTPSDFDRCATSFSELHGRLES